MVMPFEDNTQLEIRIRMDKGTRVLTKISFFVRASKRDKKIQSKLYFILT